VVTHTVTKFFVRDNIVINYEAQIALEVFFFIFYFVI
jgi:hypothetical protein